MEECEHLLLGCLVKLLFSSNELEEEVEAPLKECQQVVVPPNFLVHK